MKQSSLLIALLLCMSFSYADKKVKGNGKMTTTARTTSDYDGIACAGSFDFVLVVGTEGRITLEGEENLLEYIITEVKDDKLVIKTAKNINLKPSRNKMIKITIPFKDISNVSLAGSGDLWNTDVIIATHFKVALAGSGDVVLNVENSTTEGSIAGSGDLTLKGNTNQLIAKVAGSGDFHGFDLQANLTEVSVAGSGDAKVVSNQSLKARVAGSGDIEYRGNPKTEDFKVSGSGSISN
jgi:hypothetical protein